MYNRNYFVLLHPFIVHVSIISTLLSFLSSLLAYYYKIKGRNNTNFDEKCKSFRFTSFYLLFFGLVTLPLAIITGFIDAGSLVSAANNPILSTKIRLAFVLFFVMMGPFTIYIYTTKVLRSELYLSEGFLTFLYVVLLGLSTVTILVIGALGGYYNNGHDFFDNIGLGKQFLNLLPNDNRQSIFDTFTPSLGELVVYLFLILIPLKFKK